MRWVGCSARLIGYSPPTRTPSGPPWKACPGAYRALADVRTAAHRAERVAARRRRRVRLVLVAGVLGLVALGAVPVTQALRPAARPPRRRVDVRTADQPAARLADQHPRRRGRSGIPPADHQPETETGCQIRATLPATPQRLRPEALPAPENVWISGRRAAYSDDGRAGPEVRWTYSQGAQVAVSCGSPRRRRASSPCRWPGWSGSSETPLLLPFALPPLPAGVRRRLRRVLRGADPGGTRPGRRSTEKQRRPVSGDRVPGQPTATRRRIDHHQRGATPRWPSTARRSPCASLRRTSTCAWPRSPRGTAATAERRAAVRASRSSLVDIAKGLRIADPVTDRATWFDARESFPR